MVRRHAGRQATAGSLRAASLTGGKAIVTDQIDRVAPPPRGSTYAELSRQVRNAGLLRPRSRYYAWKIALTAAVFATAWTAFVVLGNSWWQLLLAVVFAGVFTQIGFLGHDAGHRQVFGSRGANYLLGILLGNLAIGLSYGWWVDKHNRHHAHPNQEDKDPDLEVGALAFTPGQAAAAGRLARLAYRYQAQLFFPLLLLEAVSLHVASVQALIRRTTRHQAWEAALLAVHFAGYLGAVFLVLSPLRAVLFIVVHQGLFGVYLGCSFAPNHKGMPLLEPDDERDFLRRQVLTSRNVRGGRLVDFALGALNYQIEHHLFPSMPRPNLRHSQPIVRDFCLRHDLPYTQTGLIGSYRQALRYLAEVGRTPPGVPRLPDRAPTAGR